MAECVKVIVRCRPINTREKNLKCKEVIDIESQRALCSIKNPADKNSEAKPFTFDGAYDTKSTTEQIYADIGFPLVEGVTEGYNGTIFAYGQTGCGKSFTMQGILDPESQRGIIPRSFDHIFETIQVSEGVKYLVHASYLEIYNEEIRDLLGKDIKQKLELKEHPDKGVYVQSLSMHPCKAATDCEKVMERGWKNRSTGSTLMNADSSRSHSIFSIHVERYQTDGNGKEHIRAAKLNLVDLAGSERQAKTGSTGERFKEATKINLSLSALGNVISALVDGRSKHIPYRDSKLTRLLQDSLGGNTKTLMIACLSPADNNYDESLSTLRYANRAKNIKNKPKINEDPKDAMLRQYQEEIDRLKSMLENGGSTPGQGSGGGSQPQVVEKIVHITNQEEIEAAKQRIIEEYEAQMKEVKAELKSVRAGKNEIEEEMGKLRYQYESQLNELEKAQQSAEMASEQDQNDENMPPHSAKRHAVHMNTHRGKQPQQQQLNGSRADHDIDDAYKRLMELQQNMIGGELINNEERKQKQQKRKKYAEERRRRLQDALQNMDGDDLMVEIYENAQDELRNKAKLLDKERKKNESLSREIHDLQSEFEFDRIDYLDSIRKQNQEINFLLAYIEKVHPTIRRDCNYVNVERIRAQSHWDELNSKWVLPKLAVEKSHLPAATGAAVKVKVSPGDPRRYSAESYEDLRSEERYIQKLQCSEDQEIANNYFKSTRQDQLRNRSSQSITMSRSLNNLTSRAVKSASDQDEVHRMPVRLESLSHSTTKPSKRKGKATRNELW